MCVASSSRRPVLVPSCTVKGSRAAWACTWIPRGLRTRSMCARRVSGTSVACLPCQFKMPLICTSIYVYDNWGPANYVVLRRSWALLEAAQSLPTIYSLHMSWIFQFWFQIFYPTVSRSTLYACQGTCQFTVWETVTVCWLPPYTPHFLTVRLEPCLLTTN